MHPPCHTCWHEQYRNKCSIHYITVLWCTTSEDFTILVYLSNIFLCKSVLAAEDPVFISLPLRHYISEWPEEWKLHFARKCLTRKWHIKHRKMNGQWLACSFKMQKLMAVAQPAENAHCWWTLSLPLDTHKHICMKMTIFVISLTFFMCVMISS